MESCKKDKIKNITKPGIINARNFFRSSDCRKATKRRFIGKTQKLEGKSNDNDDK